MKSEKLTLEHLAPYLPHGLKILKGNGFTQTLSIYDKGEGSNMSVLNVIQGLAKPLLIPLSELNGQNYIDFGEWVFGQHFQDFHGIGEAFGYLERIWKSPITDWPYGLLNELISLQYDVFGLIESGLALNKLSQP